MKLILKFFLSKQNISVSSFTTSPCGPLSDKTCYVDHHDWLSPDKHTVTDDHSFVTNDKTTSHVLDIRGGARSQTQPRGHRPEHTCLHMLQPPYCSATCHFHARGGLFQFRWFLRPLSLSRSWCFSYQGTYPPALRHRGPRTA